MNSSAAFWPAFWTGLAGPTSLYAPVPPYAAYVGGYTVAQTFSVVGSTLSHTTAIGYAGQPTILGSFNISVPGAPITAAGTTSAGTTITSAGSAITSAGTTSAGTAITSAGTTSRRTVSAADAR